MKILGCAFTLWATAVAAGAEPADFFADYDAKSFAKLEEARQKIDVESVNDTLLSAAIFHETNARRAAKGLKPLGHMAKVRKAAAMQAEILADRRVVAHVNPTRPEKKTPTDRVRSLGLNPAYAAENVSMSYALKYEAGKPFYTRMENGRAVYSYEPRGEPLPMLSYAAFAAKLLDEWMASPEHRVNILATEPQFLGAAARRAAVEGSMDEWYAAQVFFTPLPE